MRWAWTFILVWWLVWPECAVACPTCKEALFDPAQAQQILGAAKGYAMSIGLMIGMPLLLVGGMTALIVRQARRRVDSDGASR